MGRVLVAYATKYGSTKEVAEKVAAALRDGGKDVDVRPAHETAGVDGYSAVVLGAPLYMFRWHKNARHFLSRNKKALAETPVAVFALGPMTPDKPEEFEGARQQLDKALAKYKWLTPRSIEVFGGKFDPTGLRFPDNLPAVRALPASDLRDWDAIGVWAAALPGLLGIN